MNKYIKSGKKLDINKIKYEQIILILCIQWEPRQ